MSSNSELADRLKALEEEAAKLREALSAEASPAEAPASDSVAAEPEPEPVEDDPELADRLIAQAHLLKMRKQNKEADELLKQAAAAAPNSPRVLEVVADDFLVRGQTKKAIELLGKAKDLDPTNIALERKHATAVLKGDFASQTLDAIMSGSEPAVANAGAGVWLSFIVPGSGQIVTGEVGKGIFFLAAWIAGWIWFITIYKAEQRSTSLNPMLLAPLVAILLVHIIATADASMKAKVRRPKPMDRPRPPVDLPYE